MSFTKTIRSSLGSMTPRSIFIVVFLCCIVVGQAADTGSDPRFDKGSASLARHWQHIKGQFPHEKIPDNADQLKDVGSWGKDYGVGLAKIVGPGFAIAVIALLGSIIYGLFKLIRLCICGLCCKSSDDEEEQSQSESSDSEEDERKSAFRKVWCPTIIYAVAWVFVLTGMIFGLLNNPRFSNGVDDMGNDVISVGNGAVDLGNGLLSNVSSIVALIPVTITGLEDQFVGVDPLASDVTSLSHDLNSTSGDVSDITTEVGAIDAGNTSAVSDLYSQLAGINNQSQQILSQMSSLTSQIATNLHDTLNNTLGTLDSKVGEIDDTVDGLQDTARGIIDQAKSLVDKVIKYVNDGKSYDKSRAKAVLALFVLVIIITFLIIIGYIVRVKCIFNIVAAFCFAFLFLLWFSGSIHFLFGMALYDACPVIDVTVQGLLPKDSQAAVVLQGCLYEHRSVLDSMNITAYNLTDVFDYKSQFEGFADFSTSFNFSAIDAYFDSMNGLYKYNLTSVADNMTVANFGWNESQIYTALDKLNALTNVAPDPHYYGLNNYTQADPNAYAPPKNHSVDYAMQNITVLLQVNQTIYNKTAVAKQQLYAAQTDISAMLANMTALHARFGQIKTTVNTLSTKNISNCIDILDNLQSNITGFFELGNCSFLGDAYVDIRTSLCETMQPAIDCLTVAQFLAGLALIPIAILAEVLSFRVPKTRRIGPCGAEDYEDEEAAGKESWKDKQKKGGGYAIAMTDSPVVNRRLEGLTATISTAPSSTASSVESTPASTPDFNANRRIIAEHFEHHDE